MLEHVIRTAASNTKISIMERISKSIRIDAATLKHIQLIADKTRYYTVHSIINNILDAVVDGFGEGAIIRMAKYSRGFSKNPIGNFIFEE